jgi:hypothetical protein
MTSRVLNTGVDVACRPTLAEMSEEQTNGYLALVPGAMGGTNPNPSGSDWVEAFGVCYEACTPTMVTLALKHLAVGEGVFLVAKNQTHQQVLYQALQHHRVSKNQMLLLGKDVGVFMTTDAVHSGQVKDYKVVITTMGLVEGYTLSHLHILIMSVYPSSQSSREQIIGRLNRIGQTSKTITVYQVHCGILSYVLEKHQDAASISKVIAALAQQVSMTANEQEGV